MTPLYRVALLGFSVFERNTLAAYFRLATNRVPRYEQVQILTDADFVVADADHAPSLQLVLATERQDDTIFVGHRAPPDARPCLARPIDPLHVLRELDALVAEQHAPAAASETAARVRTVIQPRRARPAPAEPPTEYPPLELELPAPAPPPPAPTAPLTPPPAPPPRTVPRPPIAPLPPPLPSALIVDDSDIAARFLKRRLQPFGLAIEVAATSREAVALIARRGYDFVFLDMELGAASELDGLALCQKIKREHATRVPPTLVVMVTAHQGELDRVRAALAGCDGFLGKPLDEEELERLLMRQGLKRQPQPAVDPRA